MTKSGRRNTYLYDKYHQMKRRCYNKKSTKYPNWGGRGIGIETWLLDFDNYASYLISILPEGKTVKDMQRLKWSIDRKNNDGNYERGNLRWSLPDEQGRNQRKRKSNTSGYQGVSYYKPGKKYRSEIRINGERKYLGYYCTPEEAFAVYCKAYLKYFGQEAYDYMLSQHPHWDATTNTRKEAA